MFVNAGSGNPMFVNAGSGNPTPTSLPELVRAFLRNVDENRHFTGRQIPATHGGVALRSFQQHTQTTTYNQEAIMTQPNQTVLPPQLSWLEQMDHHRLAGIHTLLCTGVIGDGFPNPTPLPDDPLDHHLTWEALMFRHFHDRDIIWCFDPVRGFVFPNSEMEKKFRKLMSSGEQNTPRDPVQAQIQSAMQNVALPITPIAALSLMFSIFREASVARIPLKCAAILPDVDVYCSGSGMAGGQTASEAALAIVQMAAHDTMGRLGHTIVMSAPTPAAVHERLRRPNTPIAMITIRKPDQEQRLRFLQHLCSDESSLHEQRNVLTTLIAEEENAIRERLNSQIAQAQNALDAHLTIQEGLENRHPEISQHKRDETALAQRAEQFRAEIAREQQAYNADLEAKRSTMTTRLKDDPSLTVHEMTSSIWQQRLRAGDLLSFEHTSGSAQCRVLSLPSAGEVTLSAPGDFNRPQTNSESGETLLFCFRNGGLCARRPNQGFWTALTDMRITWIPKNRTDLEQELKNFDVMNPLWKDDASAPQRYLALVRQLAETERSLKTTRESIEQLRASVLHEWNETKGRLTREREELQMAYDQPNSQVLATLKGDLQRVVEALNARKQQGAFSLPKMGLPTMARLCQGMGYRDMAMIMREAQADKMDPNEQTILARRQQILTRTYGHLMQIVTPSYGFEGIAGLDKIKQELMAVRDAIRSGDLRRVPMGLLLMGPPGTGKTAIAEAAAQEFGFLFVKPGNVRNMFVGESERQAEEMFSALRDLAPVVVLRDEVDEQDSGRDSYQGDSGVSGRIRQMWMEFLSDPKIRGRVFVISCTNRPDRMDAALKRSGRTDERAPLPMPEFETREQLFRVMIRRYGYETILKDFSDFANLTDGLSGADIEVIVRRANVLAANVGKKQIDQEALHLAIENFIPSASQRQIAMMTLYALRETSDRRWLPDNWEELVQRSQAVLKGEAPASSSDREKILVAIGPEIPEA